MSDTDDVKLPNGHLLSRNPDGSFKMSVCAPPLPLIPPVTDVPPDAPLLPFYLGLPADMAMALERLRTAKHRDLETPRVQDAVAVLSRYVSDARELHTQRKCREKGLPEPMDGNDVATALMLVTQLHEQQPAAGIAKAREAVAKSLGRSERTLRRQGIKPIPKPEK